MTDRFGSFTPKKYPRMFVPGNSDSQPMTQTTKDHGYTLPRKDRRLMVGGVRHSISGILILVASMPMKIPMTGGKMLPPTSSMTSARRIRTRPPCFFSTNLTAHTV
jgi:hypothetical protein